MPTSIPPTASEILDLIARLERDPVRRVELSSGWSLFEAAVAENLVGPTAIDWIGQAVQQLVAEELVTAGMTRQGPQPPPVVWDGHWLQQHFNFRTTAKGRADAALFRTSQTGPTSSRPAVSGKTNQRDITSGPDVFISHATEDKAKIARPLAEALRASGMRVWYDEFSLRLGDSLRRSIDRGLATARYGVVILSPSFFAKDWPQRELDGLVARETLQTGNVILPIWHEIDAVDIARYSPTLADRYAVKSSDGLGAVVTAVRLALGASDGDPDRTASDTSAEGVPRLRFTPVPDKVELDLMMAGRQLVALVAGALEFVLDMDAVFGDDHRQRAAGFLQHVKDLGDILSDLDLPARVEEEARLNDELFELLKAGLVVYAGRYERTLISEDNRDRWPGLVVRIAPAPAGEGSADDPSPGDLRASDPEE